MVAGIGHATPGVSATVGGGGRGDDGGDDADADADLVQVGLTDGGWNVSLYNMPMGIAIAPGPPLPASAGEGSATSSTSRLLVGDSHNHRLRAVTIPAVIQIVDSISAADGEMDEVQATAGAMLELAAQSVGGHWVLAGLGAVIVFGVLGSSFAAAGAAAGTKED